VIALFLAACAAPEGGDTAAKTAPTCEPLDVTLTQEWVEGALPNDSSVEGTQPGVAIGDLDGDGWLDVFMAYAGGSMVLRNDGAGGLVESGFTADGGALPFGEAVALADIDGDGDLDAHLGRWRAEDLLLVNDGAGAFTTVTLAGSAGATFSGAFADADADGDLDLFVAAGAVDMSFESIRDGLQVGDPNLLYLRGDDGAYALAEGAMPEDTRYGITFQGAWLDAEDDGDLDLYVANDGGPYLEPNHLLLNDGAAHFTKAAECFCDLTMFAMGVAVGDADGTGTPDLYVTDVGGPNLLLAQGDGTYVDATAASGAAIPPEPTSMVSWGTSFVDLDADQDLDLVVTFGRSGSNFISAADVNPDWVDGDEQPDVILLNGGDGHFTRATGLGFADPERTRSMAVGDLDRDGRPDLVTAGKHFLRAWRTSGGCGPGVTVALDAGPLDRHGIGARVTTEVAGVVTHQWMLPSGTGASNAPELYFGLGGAAAAERLTVRWVDGAETVVEGVAAGSVLTIPR
jgi:hypothetical protein